MVLRKVDTTTIELPPTLMIDTFRKAPRRGEERAPFSSKVIITGDGLPVAEPFEIRGKVYFQSSDAANDWYFDLREALGEISTVEIDGWTIQVAHVSAAAVPTGVLGRVLDLTLKIYPSDVKPTRGVI